MSKSSRARRAAERESFVLRPFEGMASETDLVAIREIVPAATTQIQLLGEHAERKVTAVTVLPLALPCLSRSDGSVLVAMQTQFPAGDASRQVAAALLAALAIEPGATPSDPGIKADTPRLQELIDPAAPLEITVHDGFEFWVENPAEMSDEVKASLEKANEAAPPTARLESVTAAYWSDEGDRAWVRWVMPHEEYPLLNALARLHEARSDGLGEGTRYVGSFRCHGLLAPVWEVPKETPAAAFEDPAAEFSKRLAEALADDTPLTSAQRRAREGLASRQLTIR
ncbi:MAG: DUF5926 family protein [Sporichthyaceae bacterium]